MSTNLPIIHKSASPADVDTRFDVLSRRNALESVIGSMRQSGWGISRFTDAIMLLDEYVPTKEVVSLIGRGFFDPDEWASQIEKEMKR